MGQLSDKLYNFVKKWDRDDLNIAAKVYIEATSIDEDARERVFEKSYNACEPVYVQKFNRAYLANVKWSLSLSGCVDSQIHV